MISGANHMLVQAAFSAPGRWYRGNLHTHSTISDGGWPPAEIVAYYQRSGYNFVALTDHLTFCNAAGLGGPDMLAIPGVEVHGKDPTSSFYHIVGLGGDLGPGERLESSNSLQGDVNRLRQRGALVHLAHPYWLGQHSSALVPIEGVIGLEVYNGVCDQGYFKGYSNVHWDDLLLAGRRLWGLAVDDAHWMPWRNDSGLGWVMVKAPELTAPAILSALQHGCFYASTGPTIHDVRLEGNEIVVSCSPAMSIASIGDRWFVSAARSITGHGITAARLKLWDGQTFARVEVTDRAGKKAWSNPIWVADAPAG
jgi:hypothetical protein